VTSSRPWRGASEDYPVGLVGPQDPLTLLKEFRATRGRMQEMATGSPQPRIGFACMWDKIPESTWSSSAWNLRAALRLAAETTDIGVPIPRLPRTILQAIYTRPRSGRLTSTWYYSRLTDAYIEHALRRELSRNPAARGCDAVLTIHDLAVLPVPFFTYSDVSYDAVIHAAGGGGVFAAIKSMTPATVARRRERQLAIYERATGIIAESRWLARSLVEQTGVPPEKVHVAPPGISAGWVPPTNGTLAVGPSDGQGGDQLRPPLPERAATRRRLLFVGGDFYRKGGDLIVAALAVLRREHDPQITLTVAGPQAWPLPGTPPDGVRFLGSLPPDEVAPLYDSHDLFVMPSRREPFGLVFAEALARGLPCVARDAFAMPEIITPGVSGFLITRDDKNELAAAIAAALADDALYESCYERAPEMAEYFSWERTALQVTDIITQALQSAP
jgi:glycosyltransferase involved in cell wall biosynthesis